MILTLVGCSKYHSKYKAVGFVHSNDLSSAYMNFYTFEGRMVFKLKSSGEGDLKYSAKLESGSATVYYDYLGTKSKLFSVSGGEELASYGGYVDTGTVYIIGLINYLHKEKSKEESHWLTIMEQKKLKKQLSRAISSPIL